MTVKQVLVMSPWNVTYSGNKNWEHFINDVVGKWNCSFPAIIPKDLNYYELWQKKHGVIRVFQDGNYCDFYKMNPCKDALCVHFLGLPLALAEIFEYRQKPFSLNLVLALYKLVSYLFVIFIFIIPKVNISKFYHNFTSQIFLLIL